MEKIIVKEKFTNKVVKEIAEKNLGHLLDCILGYSDSGYDITTEVEYFEQNFSEDLEERGLLVNNRRLQVISRRYEKMVKDFEKFVRNRYKNIYR